MEVRHSESVLWRRGYWLIVRTWLHEANSESFASSKGRDVLKGPFGMTKWARWCYTWLTYSDQGRACESH